MPEPIIMGPLPIGIGPLPIMFIGPLPMGPIPPLAGEPSGRPIPGLPGLPVEDGCAGATCTLRLKPPDPGGPMEPPDIICVCSFLLFSSITLIFLSFSDL